MMQKHILERYAQTDDGKVIIDIAAGKIEDLYNDFDKQAPYIKKELDQDFVDYLVDSVREIGNREFIIQFYFATPADTEQLPRVQTSIDNYFLYLKELELREFKQMIRASLILLLIGITVLTLSIWVNEYAGLHKSVISQVFAEGLTVAAWVSLWEALATFLINWVPHRRKIRLYERLIKSSVFF